VREGYFADLVLVKPDDPWTVSANDLHYKCQWSPLIGLHFSNRVTHTFVNGHLAYNQGTFNGKMKGRRLTFSR
jgi:dihydroorotase